jgi:predicted nucleic acid-binding protein
MAIAEVQDRLAVELLLPSLGAGEAEVITLAKERGATRVVMDDLDARRFARRVDLQPIGTLGLLLAARLRGEIPSLRSDIRRLEAAGFYASEALVAAVLEAAGE